MPLRDVVRLIRGRKGTRVELTVLRQGEKTERFHVAIVRDKIDLEEQAAKLRFEERELDGKTLKLAVIELPSFYGDGDGSDQAPGLARRAAAARAGEARRRRDGLLLDLSRNGGGLLERRRAHLGLLRAPRARWSRSRAATRAASACSGSRRRRFCSGPLVVLTSRVSASASEILAGALKDYRRAVIVGDDHTFGKGTVQSLDPLPPGLGALKITTGLFFRPGGTSTQHSGVAADVVMPSFLTEDVGERTSRTRCQGRRHPVLRERERQRRQSERFQPLSNPIVTELARRSQARVAGNVMFKEIEEQVAKRKADDGVVRLSELLAEQEQDKAKNGTLATEQAAGEAGARSRRAPTPHLNEALQVLADLVRSNPREAHPWRSASSPPAARAHRGGGELREPCARRCPTPQVEVAAGGAGHFEVEVVSAAFAGLSRVPAAAGRTPRSRR